MKCTLIPELLNVAEVAKLLHCSKSLVYQLADEGELPSVRVGGKDKRGKLLFYETDIAEYLEACRVNGKEGD